MTSGFYRTSGKRIVDVCVVILSLVLFMWFILVLILLLFVVSGEMPLMYKASRIGKDGKLFTMLKFRTLNTNEQLPLKDRQFWLGKFLRATNLDELPQLWNVLKGEMSLVGPRPLPIEYEPLLSNEQKQRHSVLPGITGLAQVNGKNTLSWEKKFEFDLQYVREISMGLDLKILLKTVALVVQMNKDVSLDEKRFLG